MWRLDGRYYPASSSPLAHQLERQGATQLAAHTLLEARSLDALARQALRSASRN